MKSWEAKGPNLVEEIRTLCGRYLMTRGVTMAEVREKKSRASN